jgi:hypothetical protein
MRLTIFLSCFLFTSSAMAEEALNTVTIQFENEQQPTADAGVGPGMDVVRDGEYLFMLQQRNLVILSVKDPAGPVVVGELKDIGNLRQIVVRDNVAYRRGAVVRGLRRYLYAGAWEECRVAICDVRNPANPRQVAEVELNGRGDGLCVENGILYAPV